MRPTSVASLVLFLSLSVSPLAAQEAERLLGVWSCDTSEGRARLEFLSDSELSYNGERLPYMLTEEAIRVVEDFWPVDYRYKFDGDQLIITNPDFSVTRCRRQVARSSGPGGGLESSLQGHRCDYTSSPDGGASSSRHLYFDGNGRFVLANDASIWVEGGIAIGENVDGETGNYQVMGTNQGDEVHLSFDGGAQVVMYVHVVDGSGTIHELWYKGRSFARALCQ